MWKIVTESSGNLRIAQARPIIEVRLKTQVDLLLFYCFYNIF